MNLTCRPSLLSGAQKSGIERDHHLMKMLGYYELDTHLGACKRWINVMDPALERLIGLLDESDTLLTDIHWNKSEVEKALGYRLVCTTIGMSDADNMVQTQSLCSSIPVSSPSKWGQISVFKSLRLNSVKLKKGTIRYLDQWTEALILAEDVFRSWPSDWSQKFLGEVENRKGSRRTDLYQFLPYHLMPCVSENTIGHYETWDEGPTKPSTARFRRALTYDKTDLESMPLMAVTAEPFGALDQGLVVVSKAWRQWCLQNTWKGPKFHPLLEMGSPLWKQFEEQWARLLQLAEARGIAVY